ncbi:MAG: WD40/YVTN/BNR-like repeat-containing protein [Bryobacteraceae bacterium]
MLSQTLRFGIVLAVALGCCGQRPGNFVVIGPGGGGAMFNPTISPHDANTVLVSCDMTGSYITHDGGQSWRMFNLGGTVKFFAFDPKDSHIIYAETSVLWRSEDGGRTWKLLYPNASSVKRVQMNSDHAEETVIAEPDPLGAITALAIDPDNSRTLYVTGSKASANGLFVSRDSGQSWKRETSLSEPALHIWVDPQSTQESRTLIIGCPHSIYLKSASGVEKRAAPESAAAFTELAAGFQNSKAIIYGVTGREAFVSRDRGASWQKCVLTGGGAQVRAVATSLNHPGTAYLSYNELELGGQKWHGVAKTTDAGQSWRLNWKEGRKASANIQDAWINERFGPEWGENPLMLGVADDDPNLCYTTDFGRTMKSTDGGATWMAVYSRRIPPQGWTSTGLDVTTNYGIHFDPFDMRRQFITYTDIGLFRSEDGGKSWVSSTMGVPEQWVNTTYWMVFDPDVRGRVWSVNSGTHDLPRPKMWRKASVLNYKGGVCRSNDGGRTWTKSNSGMEETAATHILLDRRSSPNTRTLYVAGFGRGVYKSTDGGETWTLRNSGIKQKEPFAWRLAQASDGALYVLIARRSDEGGMGHDRDGAIYRSTDGAEHWNAVAMPEGVNAPNGLLIHPKFPQRLYLAAWARASGMHGEGGGIYRSSDAGRTWRQVLDRDQHVYDVTIDPRDPMLLFASGFESSAWRSIDGGEHWRRIAGFNFKWGHRVIPDPLEKENVYVTTFGGSVWHGSVNGQAKPLDIVTPILEPGELP